jgi:hypothetical protein
MDKAPRVKIHEKGVGKVEAPKYDVLPKVPRLLILGPSGSGKTQLMVSMIKDMYIDKHGDSVYQRIYIFSPSIWIDPAWAPVREFVKDKLGVDDKDEQCFFDKFDAQALTEIVATQKKVIELQRARKMKKLYQILVVLDDLADSRVAMHSNHLIQAFLKGRHVMQSTWVSVQKLRAVDNAIRVNATDMVVFRLRSNQELRAFLEESSAVFGWKILEVMYNYAVGDEPYSFLYLKLNETDPKKFAWLRFEEPLYDKFVKHIDLRDPAPALPEPIAMED